MIILQIYHLDRIMQEERVDGENEDERLLQQKGTKEKSFIAFHSLGEIQTGLLSIASETLLLLLSFLSFVHLKETSSIVEKKSCV